MVFAVNVAADVSGSKRNYILEFPYPPSFTELIARAESVLTNVRGTPFVVTHMESFDEGSGEWSSVTSMDNVKESCQLYVFEPESWKTDTQQQIPPPVLPPMVSQAPVSATPAATPIVTSAPATTMRLPTVGIAHPPETPSAVSMASMAAAPRKHLILSPVDEAASQPPLGSPTPATAPTTTTSIAINTVPRGSVIPTTTTAAAAPRHVDIRSSTAQSIGLVTSATPRGALRPEELRTASALDTSSLIRPLEELRHTDPIIQLTAQSLYTDVTHDEKVRYTYEHLVNHYSGSFSIEDWTAASRQLQLPLPLQRVRELFMKADANKDGTVTEGEWARFTERYPALLQSVYYRMRDDEEGHIREIELENAKIQLTVQQTALRNKVQDLSDCQELVAQRERELLARDNTINKLLQSHQVLESTHQNYLLEIEAAAEHAAERERQMQGQVNSHNEVVQQVNDAVDACDACSKQYDTAKESLAIAENGFVIAREHYDGAVSSLEQTTANGEALYHEYSNIRNDVSQSERSITEAIRGTAVRTENLSFLEERVNALTAEHANLEGIFAKATSDLLICQRQSESERKLFEETLSQTAALEAELAEAKSLGAHYMSTLAALEKDNASYNNRRRLVEDQEKPLVLEELQLRETIALSSQKYVQHSSSFLTAD